MCKIFVKLDGTFILDFLCSDERHHFSSFPFFLSFFLSGMFNLSYPLDSVYMN